MQKMPSIVSVVDSIFARARSFHSLLYDDDRRRSEVETVDKQSEMDDVFSQTKKKRRKVQRSLCVNSEYANRIIDWLGKDDITTVGIYGMGGIGKTTLAVHLYNLLQNNDIPSANSLAIAWVTMEIDFTIYELQKRIAAAFGLNLEGNKDENRRAAMLCAYLSVTDNKCILFIDGLWGDFRREDVGIPRNCKLIVISRLLDVCRMLCCQKTIKVEPLSEEESWQLFQHSIAGIGVSDSIQLSHDKKLVFDECAGLPLAITALANSSMTGTINASMWREFSIESTQMEGTVRHGAFHIEQASQLMFAGNLSRSKQQIGWHIHAWYVTANKLLSESGQKRTEMMDAILEIGSQTCEFGKQLVEVDMRHTELSNVLQEVMSKVEDMEQDMRNEEALPGKKRKEVSSAYLNQVKRYKESAQSVLAGSNEGQRMLKRMMWVPSIERHRREGQELLSRVRKLQGEGLTYDEVRMRGEMLPVDEDQYTCKAFSENLESALRVMKNGTAQCIGIYGYSGSGKTNLMKHLYNQALEDRENFNAVFWATAPEPDNGGNYHKALQKCVADAMWLDLEDKNAVHDEVRSAARIMARLQEIKTGRAVFFLDNLKKEFPAYELVGIPSLERASVKCILVFNTLSKNICKGMQCDLTLKMELLEREEARELFLHEVKRGDNENQMLSYQDKRIQKVAVEVADECARMPLAVIVVARSMACIKDHHEWNNRLNELKGTISSIHGEEDTIIEHLKFGFFCLKGRILKDCFLNAATLLSDDKQVPEVDIIHNWKESGLIRRNHHHADDQGHTILNQLQRVCLLQVAPDNRTVTMNKWISKSITSTALCPPTVII